MAMAFSCRYRRASVGGYDEERFENEVDSNLLCPICLKVLKGPVQCPNEHYFCRSCVEKHLHENSETCPMCQHHLTKATLTKPPRFLMEMLLGLKIRCDYTKQGCRELIKIEFLDRHVENCGYSPMRMNSGCSQEINQGDEEQGESELCRSRMVVCGECGQKVLRKSRRAHPCFMRNEVDRLVKEMSDDAKQTNMTQEEFINNLVIRASNQDDVINDLRRRNERMRHEMDTMRAEMAFCTEETTERNEWYNGQQRVFICGGRDENTRHNSVESYSWADNTWREEPAMKEVRSGPSAFVHEGQIFVTGGWTGTKNIDSIESLDVDEEHVEWTKLPVKMPIKCKGHKMICHDNAAILIGGCEGENISDGIYKINLSPPYDTKLLTQMPEPRFLHSCEIFDNQVVIAAGATSRAFKENKNTMLLFNVNNNQCKPMAPLPIGICEMATVNYKNNIICIGGANDHGKTLNTVMMYDIKTGKTKMLPCLNHKRAASAAVIIGNVVLVMGGRVPETKTYLDSVECLDLNTNVWRELPPMKTKRAYPAAVVKSIF